MSNTTRRDVLTGAAGLAAAVTCPTAALGDEASTKEAVIAAFGSLAEEICRRGFYREGLSALGPFLDHMGRIAISKYLVTDAIEAIEHLYDPGDEWPTLQPLMRECSAFVAVRLKREASGEPPPFRCDPDL
jgi:hypothetical protein